jgi:hypothetical protein
MNSEITLYITGKRLEVTMPRATTGKYAAKRVAEALGFDDDDAWILIAGLKEIPGDEIMADHDGETVWLGFG